MSGTVGIKRSESEEESSGCTTTSGSGGGRRRWSSVSDDLMRKIFQKLCLSDQIRATAICKSWRIRIPRVRVTDHLPWLISKICYDQAAWTALHQVVLKITLYEPGNSNPNSIKNPIDDVPITNIEPWYRPRILESKLGWLLIEIMDVLEKRSWLVLYTPFGNSSSKPPHVLPPVFTTIDERVIVATFSSPPTSPDDCIVFVYVKNLQRSAAASYEMRTWRVGEDRWGRHPINTPFAVLTKRITGIAHVNGILYCYFYKGMLLAFNAFNGAYQLLFPESDDPDISFGTFNVLVEYNNQLLLLSFDHMMDEGGFEIYNREVCHVYGYDVSANIWVRIPKLFDHVVGFVSSTWHVLLVPVPARQILLKTFGIEEDYGGMVGGEFGTYEAFLGEDDMSGLYCLYATYETNAGVDDHIWLSYPFFD